MSGNFDWFTEEDESAWEDARVSPPKKPPRRRRWPLLLLGLSVLSLTGYAITRQVNQRVAESQRLIEADVLAANELVQRAAANADRELLTSMLSGRDADWTQVQKELLEAGLLFGGSATPFGLEPIGTGPISTTVSLSNDFKEAVVTERREYARDAGNGLTDNVTLDQTFVFRQGERNWLFAPPKDEFWGDWSTIAGDRVSVAYSTRDERFAERFAGDIEMLLDALCQLHTCPANWRMSMRLDQDPEALSRLADPETRLISTRSLNLPSPTLIGTASDEAGLVALTDGYSALVIAAAMADILEWECCTRIVFYEATLDATLAELGIQPFPLRDSDYLALVNYPAMTGSGVVAAWDARSLDNPEPLERTFAHAVIDYFLSEGAELSQITHDLIASGASRGSSSLNLWTRRVTGSSFSEAEWYDFVRERAASYQSATQSPIPLPEQDLMLACASETGPDAGLYRYVIADGALSLEVPLPNTYFYPLALPDDSGVLLTAGLPDGIHTETLLLRGGEELARLLWADPGAVMIYLAEPVDPLGQYAPIWVFDQESPGPNFAVVDTADCLPGSDCQPTELPGAPVWSPNGQRLIVEQNDGTLLLGRRDLTGWEPLGEGRTPFWVNDETYGFIGMDNLSIFLSGLDTDEQRLLLTTEDLAEALPQNQQRFQTTLQIATTRPEVPNTLFVLAAQGFSGDSMLFRVTLPPEEVVTGQGDPLPPAMSLLVNRLAFLLPQPIQMISPDGRWLAAYTSQAGLQLYNLDTGEMFPVGIPSGEFSISQHDWSADSPWVAFVGSQNVELVAPLPDGEIFRRVIFHDGLRCSSAIWVNSLP